MLDFDKVKKLQEVASGNDRKEVSLLHDAVLDRMNAYKDRSTAANKKDWDAAKEGLAERVTTLWPKYFPGESSSLEPEVFTKQKDALAYIKEKGCKVSAGKFSKDWNNGNVRLQKDKSVARGDLLAYAATLDVDQQAIDETQEIAKRKGELEIRRLEQQVERADIDNREKDSLWVLREEATDQTACLVVILRDTLRHHCSLTAPAVILAAGGDPQRAVEVESALNDIVSDSFNELSSSREARLIGLVDPATDEEDEDE